MPYSNKSNLNFRRRKRLRLKNYDYSKAGCYFVTIDCKNLECRFGRIQSGKMILNDFGEIAYEEWLKLPIRYNHFHIDIFQIMPNHMHAIVSIKYPDRFQNETLAGASPANTEHKKLNKSLSDIIGSYKSIVANVCLLLYKQKFIDQTHTPILGKIWHRGFNDHIIRDVPSYKSIYRYILNNPKNWVKGRHHRRK